MAKSLAKSSTDKGKKTTTKTTTEKGDKTMKTKEVKRVTIKVTGYDKRAHKVSVPAGINAGLISKLNQQDRALEVSNSKAFKSWIMKGKFWCEIKQKCGGNTVIFGKEIDDLAKAGVVKASGKNERAAAMKFYTWQVKDKVLKDNAPAKFLEKYKNSATPIEAWRKEYCDSRVNPEGVLAMWRKYKAAVAGKTTHSKKQTGKANDPKSQAKQPQEQPNAAKLPDVPEALENLTRVMNSVIELTRKKKFSQSEISDIQRTLATYSKTLTTNKRFAPKEIDRAA